MTISKKMSAAPITFLNAQLFLYEIIIVGFPGDNFEDCMRVWLRDR